MKIPSLFILLLVMSSSLAASSAHGHDAFLECLSKEFKKHSSICKDVYTVTNSSYASVLQSNIRNTRFAASARTPKPLAVIIPEHESQIPPIVYCARQSNLEIRTRSGGHDFEGLSYMSRFPFVIVDLIKLSEVAVDVAEKNAWVGAGATLGSLYYRIAEKSSVLGFPGGLCHTVGVGGHFSGGGYGTLMRKYGLAADNVIDARIVDANGRILDRESMGEDLFWAIRGGGGASFGVILAWEVQLVDVPETVTAFTVNRSLAQNATQLVDRWQLVAPQLDRDLLLEILIYRVNSTIHASFLSLFLGRAEKLLQILQESFPELGVVREDCSEMSWIESTVYFSQLTGSLPFQPEPIESLLSRTPHSYKSIKIRSDYVQKPIPEDGLQGMIRLLYELEAANFGTALYMVPYGGRMAEIPESATPFPHRAGNLYKLACLVIWPEDEAWSSDRYISWSRRYYSYMAPYVSKYPRGAFFNYRDLDLGVNEVEGDTSYEQASIWGKKYFKNNFNRLVRVKTMVDPDNFFKNEQSIPPLYVEKQ